MNSKLKTAVIIAAVAIISALTSFFTMVAWAGKSDKVFPGVTVRGTDLGNMTKTEAGQVLEEYARLVGRETVTIRFDGHSGSVELAGAGLDIKVDAMVNKAWSIGREGNLLTQWQERRAVAQNGREIPLEFSVSRKKFGTVINEMTKAVRVSPKDAALIITDEDTVEVIDSAKGVGVDIDDGYRQLNKLIEENKITENPEIALQLIDINPARTKEDLEKMRVNGLLASFTTKFDAGKTNRVYNIKVAAAALDGQMIKPGEEFSFNSIVGPRSQEAGYKMAPTILNNEFIDSLGGGVCQVSTTLYNTLLLANVEIKERSNHSLVVSYVPLGQDAAVSYGGKDLKFRNNLPGALIIKSSVSGNRITLKLFGDTSLRKTIKVVNTVVKEYPFKIIYKDDPALPKGEQVVDQKGVKGYRVTSRMLIYEGGNLVESRTLSPSYYKPLDQVVLVGTKPVPAKPVQGGQTGDQTGDQTGNQAGDQAGQPPNGEPGGDNSGDSTGEDNTGNDSTENDSTGNDGDPSSDTSPGDMPPDG